jgi:hypothetical protein
VQYFVPSAFVVANVALLPALAFAPARGPVAVAAALYLVLLAGAVIAARGPLRRSRVLVGLGIYLTHLTYGLGFLAGLGRPELDH